MHTVQSSVMDLSDRRMDKYNDHHCPWLWAGLVDQLSSIIVSSKLSYHIFFIKVLTLLLVVALADPDAEADPDASLVYNVGHPYVHGYYGHHYIRGYKVIG